MKPPLRYRRQIPFFHDKSAEEMRQDPYERYDPTVVRQTALHLCDAVWGGYPMQAVLDFTVEHLPETATHISEVGCGVGRLIGELARRFPEAQCWGLDHSYQMLRQASAYWTEEQTISLNLANKGYAPPLSIEGQRLQNLQFGLALAEALPFSDNSQDIVLHSFLIDRLADPQAAFTESHRVLKPDGLMIFMTPLNFQKAEHWLAFYPPVKLYHSLSLPANETGSTFKIIDWRENIRIEEPLDLHGNAVHWNCLGAVVRKK